MSHGFFGCIKSDTNAKCYAVPTRCSFTRGLPTQMVGVKRLPTRRLRWTNQSSFLQMHTIMLLTRDAYAILPTKNAYASLRISFSPMRTAYAINF
eukprot:Skav235406  [mRNA]  locus=scaffold487:173104:173402:+ [translate_table: standard]